MGGGGGGGAEIDEERDGATPPEDGFDHTSPSPWVLPEEEGGAMGGAWTGKEDWEKGWEVALEGRPLPMAPYRAPGVGLWKSHGSPWSLSGVDGGGTKVT